jgi:hypothetical protein
VQRDAYISGGSNDWTNYSMTAGTVGTAGGNAAGAPGSTANPIVSAQLKLNGQDRFAERMGPYFNLVQPFQHHENVPSNIGINVYSFALKPEEHQPSGSLNMSRIDTAVLALKTQSTLSSSKVKVFASSYNVNKCVEKLHAYGVWETTIRNIVKAPTFVPVASVWKPTFPSRKIPCCSGKPLGCFASRKTHMCQEPLLPSVIRNYDMVMNNKHEYGNNAKDWATRMLTFFLNSKERASETERVSVKIVDKQSRLKIQSKPFWKLKGITVLELCQEWVVWHFD